MYAILDYTETHTHTDTNTNTVVSSLGPSWQLRSGWTGKLELGWQVGARLADTGIIRKNIFSGHYGDTDDTFPGLYDTFMTDLLEIHVTFSRHSGYIMLVTFRIHLKNSQGTFRIDSGHIHDTFR